MSSFPTSSIGFTFDVAPMEDTGTSRIKRAKSKQKITRNRKITSCLQCRERKQKCDRTRPVCSNCFASNSRGGMCTYVDEQTAEDDQQSLKRIRQISPEVTNSTLLSASNLSRPRLPARSPLTTRRLQLVEATARAGRDRSLDFDIRVRYARAAAIGTILFGTPQSVDSTPQVYQPLAAVDSLKLPTAAEVGPLLDIYRRNVEWMCNVVLVDLNRARFESFLNWWHSHPQTLPADPPLIPLFLTILALAIQAKRMTPFCTVQDRGQSRAKSPREPFLETYSSEKELLETAQRCIDVLQIACPSNWASAFSAPLDLVRASLLRGLWHLTELHSQFAGSCLAATMRLAHAASLNHDTRHWPAMGKEESQARRNIFWSVASLEVMFSTRYTQPSVILQNSYDTSFPDDYSALLNLYRYGGLIEPYIVEGRRSRFRISPITEESFDFHLARFQLVDVLIKGQELFRSGNKKQLAEAHAAWRAKVPRNILNIQYYSHSSRLDDNLDTETHYLQSVMLQMMDQSALLQIHRPHADKQGRWLAPEDRAEDSLGTCIQAAQRLITLIHAIITRRPGPPYVLFHQCIFYCFQAAIVIAIQNALSTIEEEQQDHLRLAMEVLDLIAQQEGLRYVAEQSGRYADTLREIEATQRRARAQSRRVSIQSNDIPSNSPTRNAQRTALGVQAIAVVEGNGKLLGGQGYPAGHANRPILSQSYQGARPAQTVPELISLTQQQQDQQQSFYGIDSGSIPSMQGMPPPQIPYGIDFNDLQIFASTAPLGDDSFADRSLPIMVNSNGGGEGAAVSSGANAIVENVTTMQEVKPITANYSGGLNLLAATIPPQNSTTSNFNNTAATSSAMPFRDSFATDWNEWERAVERLLYSESTR